MPKTRRLGPGQPRPRRAGDAGGVEALVELIGAVFILSAFVLVQMGRMEASSLAYLVLNLAGSATLAVVAAIDGDVGFLLLEAVWAVVSAYGVARLVLRPSRPIQ